MANKTTSWHGAKDGSWTEADNWTNGAPNTDTSNDTLIFLADAINPPTSGLDRNADAAASGLRPQLVYVEEGVWYPIGAPNNPLVLRAIKVIHKGDEALYYRAIFGQFTDEFIVNSPNQVLAADIDAIGATGITWLSISQGHVTVSDRMLLDNVEMTALRGKTMPSMLVNENVAALSRLVMNGGQLDCRAPVGTFAIVNGGNAIFTNPATVPLLQVVGGVVTYDVTGTGGTITTLNAVGGTTNLIATRANPLAVENFCQFPRAKVLKDEGGDIVVIENEYTFSS